jgi:hypothetical protein
MSMTPRNKMRAYRDRLRLQGLRPVQHWVPDTRNPGFRAKVRRQWRLIGKSSGEAEALDFVEAVADLDGWR